MRIWLVSSSLQLKRLGPESSQGEERKEQLSWRMSWGRLESRTQPGLGQRELLCMRNPLEALILSPNRSLLGFREYSYPENLKWGRGKPS